MGVDLYYTVGSPPARAVAILAKHLKLDINLKETNTMAGETRTAEFLKLNPSHTVPTLVDGSFTLFESRAILAYLVNKYAPGHDLYPSDAQARANVDKVLYYDASAFVPAMKALFMAKFRGKGEATKEMVDDLKEKVSILEAILGEHKFLAGDKVTIADISMAVGVPFLKMFDPAGSNPKLEAWYERVKTAVPALAELNAVAFKIYADKIAEMEAAKK